MDHQRIVPSLAAAALAAALLVAAPAVADLRVAPKPSERPCRVERYDSPRRECVVCLASRADRERCARLVVPHGFTRECTTPKTRSQFFREVWCRARDAANPALPEAVRTALLDPDVPVPEPEPRRFAPRPPAPAPDAAPTPDGAPAPTPDGAPAPTPDGAPAPNPAAE